MCFYCYFWIFCVANRLGLSIVNYIILQLFQTLIFKWRGYMREDLNLNKKEYTTVRTNLTPRSWGSPNFQPQFVMMQSSSLGPDQCPSGSSRRGQYNHLPSYRVSTIVRGSTAATSNLTDVEMMRTAFVKPLAVTQCKLTAYFLWRELKLTADQSAAAL